MMKTRGTLALSVLATATLIAAPWVPATAAQQGSTPRSGSSGQGTAGAQSGAESQQGQRQQQQLQQNQIIASGFTAQATGKVTSIDQQSGKLTLQTPDGPMTVRFPPPAVAHVKKGDMVTVGVGLIEQNPAASPRTGGAGNSQSGSQAGPSSAGPSGASSSGTK
jgi:hypothetical protein